MFIKVKKYFLLLLLINLFLISCSDNVTNPEIYINPPGEDTEIQLGYNLNVKVDPRMELLSVVQHFTSWAEERHTRLHLQYIADIENYFKDYKNHEAIQLSQQLSSYSFNYDAPPTFVLYHTNPPEFQRRISYSSYLVNRAGSYSELNNFADALRDFAVETDFMSFFNAHKAFYTGIENNIKRTITDTNYIKILESFYGEAKQNYTIIPAPLFHTGGYGPSLETDEGEEIYDICGPLSGTENSLSFGNLEYMRYILLHEFSHSFVNPLTSEHNVEINNSFSLFEPIRDEMFNMGYGEWTTCVNEHLVRVNVARFTNVLSGAVAKNNILRSEHNKGFIYINDLDLLMQEYEDNRDKYTKYSDFFPQIIALFDSINSTQ